MDRLEKIFNFVKEKDLYSKNFESFKRQYGNRAKLAHVDHKSTFGFGGTHQDFLQTEGTYTSRMNEQYKDAEGNQLIEFIETTAGADRFKMKDLRTGKESEEIQLPSMFQEPWYNYHTLFGGFLNRANSHNYSWDYVNDKVTKFVDNPLTPDETYLSQKKMAKGDIYAAFEAVVNKYNRDIDFGSPENLKYLKDFVTNGKFIQEEARGGGTEADTDYDVILKDLKKEVGDFGGIFGGTFSPDGEYNQLDEVDIEAIISDAITQKFNQSLIKANDGFSKAFATQMKADNMNPSQINEAHLQYSKNLFMGNPEAIQLMEGVEIIKKLEPGTDEFEAQYKLNQEYLKDFLPSYYSGGELIDFRTGEAVDPLDQTQTVSPITITKEELEEQEEKIKLTYGDRIEDAFYGWGDMKFMSDRQGEEKFNVTINDCLLYTSPSPRD